MKNTQITRTSLFTAAFALLLAVTVGVTANIANAAGSNSGGGGGGGSVKTYEARVTGYITAIDYVNSTLTIGASYYGTGQLKVTSSTNISVNLVNCGFDTLKLGDWAEARYDWVSKTATKLSCTAVPTS
ncbi:MAG: hypothetical protein WCQ89_23510 [Verrucomicrobiota bacterium]|jgi:hypothetical protein